QKRTECDPRLRPRRLVVAPVGVCRGIGARRGESARRAVSPRRGRAGGPLPQTAPPQRCWTVLTCIKSCESDPDGEANELRKTGGLHLVHDLGAVDLD